MAKSETLPQPSGRPVLAINEAGWDRAARVIFGLVLLSLVFVGPKTAWGFLGVIPLFTGLVGYCPLYRVFGFSTCKRDASHREQ